MPDAERAALVARLGERLISDADARGGWGYYAGKSPRIEPTAWALLALAGAENITAVGIDATPHRAFLQTCQREDGLLVEGPARPPNFTANGTAACTLSTALPAFAERLVNGLAAVKGLSVTDPDPRQDNRLQAWPWVPDTFSWVEPTAWCTLALKQQRRRAPDDRFEPRIDEAERLLINRSCEPGGWNFGNASVLGQDLRPYVPTTALGLVALQDRRDEPVVIRAVAYLERAWTTEPTAIALSLSAIALRLHDRTTVAVETRLAQDAERAERLGNLQALSMMLFALTLEAHQAEALRV
jgi:hypothetical protein